MEDGSLYCSIDGAPGLWVLKSLNVWVFESTIDIRACTEFEIAQR